MGKWEDEPEHGPGWYWLWIIACSVGFWLLFWRAIEELVK
jgi:hypothetical protein